MIKVNLKGRLGLEFGKLWELDVKTPKEALHAINVNTDGRFIKYLDDSSRNNVAYSIVIGNITLDTKELTSLLEGPVSKYEEITITPVIGGAWAYVIKIVIEIVIAVVLSYVSMLLSASPNTDSGEDVQKESYLFSGGPQPARQGKPVPVGYGRMIVYPIAISVQYDYSCVGSGAYSSITAPASTSRFFSSVSRATMTSILH